MAYEAKVFRVLIASPSDVVEEREIAVKTIQEWNDLNSPERQIVLLPLRWETHTAPEYGKRPQEVINRQLVDHCDLLIGIFWTRIGSPTGIKDSGTLEEIDRVASSGKPVMLYFSKARKDPDEIDTEQLTKLRDFKKNTYPKALVENYSSQIEFRDKLAKQIEMQLRNLLSDKDQNLSGAIESDILMEFFDAGLEKNIGENIALKSEYLKLKGISNIPDYLPEFDDDNTKKNKGDETFSMIIGAGRPNKDYYRDLVEYFATKRLFLPVDFWLRNQGSLGAKDLYIDVKIKSDNEDIILLSSDQFNLEKPSKNKGESINILRNHNDSRVQLQKPEGKPGEWNLTFELKALQPKREICPNSAIFIGSKKSCIIQFHATIYADSLPEPINHTLQITINVNIIDIHAIQLLNDMNDLNEFLPLKSA